MKKISLRITALTLVMLILSISLVSCGGLSGKYEASILGTGTAYTFKGSKVTVDFMVLGMSKSVEGKYKIKGDKITFTFDDEEGEKYAGEFNFEKGDEYIKIGIVEYKKVD